jgi:hypothetical protein
MNLPIRVDLLRPAAESLAPQVVCAPLKIVDGGCPDEHLFAPRIEVYAVISRSWRRTPLTRRGQRP